MANPSPVGVDEPIDHWIHNLPEIPEDAQNADGTVAARAYTRDYYMSVTCEGFAAAQRGDISPIKKVELDHLGLRPGEVFLDLGCGRGEVAKAAAEIIGPSGFVVGIDYAPVAVDLAGETLAHVKAAEVLAADGTALPFADRTFDAVLLGDVIEHLTPEQGMQCLREVGRVLRPGGRILVHTAPNLWFVKYVQSVAKIALRLLGLKTAYQAIVLSEEYRAAYHVNEMALPTLRRMVEEAGFVTRAWMHDDPFRSDEEHPLVSSLEDKPFLLKLSRVFGIWPLRYFFSNDVFAMGVRL